MKSQWIRYEGVEIFFCDFRDFGANLPALREEVFAADEEFVKRPLGSVLSLADLSGTHSSVEGVKLFIESAKRTKDHVRKQAVTGLIGIQKILAQAVAFSSGQTLQIFESGNDALRWLAKDEDGGIEMRP
jgi:hypothetical protein